MLRSAFLAKHRDEFVLGAKSYWQIGKLDSTRFRLATFHVFALRTDKSVAEVTTHDGFVSLHKVTYKMKLT